MRRKGRILAGLVAAVTAACLGFQPGAALAAWPAPPARTYLPYVPYAPYRPLLPLRPAPLASVDHPPVDGVGSFDNGPRTGNQIALTFDADMTPGMLQQLRSGAVQSWYNREVREILDAEQVPATIFLTGLWANAYPEVARDLAQDPLFEIGSHTHDHAAFRLPCYGLGGAADRGAEIAVAQAEIAAATGVTPRLIRFPGDCYDRSDQRLAAASGLSVISGDVRGGDGFNQSAVSVATNVLRVLQPGSIVLLHLHGGPNAPMTAPALRLVIQAARERGLQFTTVGRLLGLDGQTSLAAQPSPLQMLAVMRREGFQPPARAAGRLDRFRRPLLMARPALGRPWRTLLTWLLLI